MSSQPTATSDPATGDAPYLPIIYLRGFTFGRQGTEATVDDPFYGFNTGSTHVRQDVTGQPRFYVFESPVLRLLADHGYVDSYSTGVQVGLDAQGLADLDAEQQSLDSSDGGHGATTGGPVRPGPEDLSKRRVVHVVDQAMLRRRSTTARPGWRSLWVYRYYDQASRTYLDSPGVRQEIEESALGLSDLIDHVKKVTRAPRVYLVGHSTGGLIIRCLLQRTYPNLGQAASEHVDKVFTYATPHGGIHFAHGGGVGEWLRDRLGGLWKQSNIDDFGRGRMWEYLHDRTALEQQARPPRDWDPRVLEHFPADRVLCLVGTNPDDYSNTVSAQGVGAHSDGLVRIESAYVKDAPRAYAHRSHSGRYGIVNSEEGYQNLERFLFGDLRVQLSLDRLDALRDRLHAHASGTGVNGLFHHLDATVAVRGLPALMHNQQLQHNSAIPVEYLKLKEGQPVPLFTVFLLSSATPPGESCRYTVRLRLHPLQLLDGQQSFDRHIEGAGSWEGVVDVDLGRAADGSWLLRWHWRYQPVDHWEVAAPGAVTAPSIEVPLPPSAAGDLGPHALLRMTPSPWNDWH